MPVFRSSLMYWIIRAVTLALLLGDSLSIVLEGELIEQSVVFPAGVANSKEAIAYALEVHKRNRALYFTVVQGRQWQDMQNRALKG